MILSSLTNTAEISSDISAQFSELTAEKTDETMLPIFQHANLDQAEMPNNFCFPDPSVAQTLSLVGIYAAEVLPCMVTFFDHAQHFKKYFSSFPKR